MYGNRIQGLSPDGGQTHGCLSSYQNVISAHNMPCPTIQWNTPTFDIWFWQHCDLKIFSNSVFSAHEILLAGGWPKTEILSIRLLGSDNCPHRPSIDTYHSLKPEAFQILWPVLNQAFSGGSQWWWDTTLLSMGSLAIGIHHHENAEKCGFIRWRKQVQILHCINHQKRGRGPRMWKNVDYWEGCPNMAGWSKETWVKRFGLDPLHVALRLDQHNFIPILLLIIIFIFVVHLFTSRYLSHWSHLKAFSPLLWSLDMWPIPSNNDLKSLLTAKCPEPVQITDARVRRTWRPLSSLISTPL